jgi:hypothetical protein
MSGVGEMEWNLNDDKNFIMIGEHHGYVCVRTGLCKIPKKNFSKSIPTFLLFYITPITFYHYSNKKITTKQKISLFYTKYYYFFPHINQISYSTSPLTPALSIAKHSPMRSLVLKYLYELKLSKMKAHLVYVIVLYLLLM